MSKVDGRVYMRLFVALTSSARSLSSSRNLYQNNVSVFLFVTAFVIYLIISFDKMSSGSLIQFESSRKTASAREALREAREVILEKAKEKAEKRREREGKEQSWMLKDLEDRIKDKKQKKKKKEKKVKKDKKAKKEKKKKKKNKKKKKKESSSSSSSDDDSDGSGEWVEKGSDVAAAEPSKKLERESWMQLGSTEKVRGTFQGEPSGQALAFDLVGPPSADSAWVSANLAELAVHLGKMTGLSNPSQQKIGSDLTGNEYMSSERAEYYNHFRCSCQIFVF